MLLDPEEFDRRLGRHARFWGEPFRGEGAYVAVRAPEPHAAPYSGRVPGSLRERWIDVDYRVDRAVAAIAGTRYLGDALPVLSADLGPTLLPALLGASYRFAENTVWFDVDPPLLEWEGRRGFSLDRESEFYRSLMSLCSAVGRAAEGRAVAGLPDIGVNLDVLAALRPRELVLMDLLDAPAEVAAALVELDRLWEEVYDECYGLLGGSAHPTSSWVPLAFGGRLYPLLSELTAMVSPEMFEEFALPALQREADALDRVLFNVDGPAQVRHLPALLKLRGLHSIEWDPVPKLDAARGIMRKDFAGSESIEVCRSIQGAGIKLVLNGLQPDQAVATMDEISADGTFLFVDCASAVEAEDFASYARRWTCD